MFILNHFNAKNVCGCFKGFCQLLDIYQVSNLRNGQILKAGRPKVIRLIIEQINLEG